MTETLLQSQAVDPVTANPEFLAVQSQIDQDWMRRAIARRYFRTRPMWDKAVVGLQLSSLLPPTFIAVALIGKYTYPSLILVPILLAVFAGSWLVRRDLKRFVARTTDRFLRNLPCPRCGYKLGFGKYAQAEESKRSFVAVCPECGRGSFLPPATYLRRAFYVMWATYCTRHPKSKEVSKHLPVELIWVPVCHNARFARRPIRALPNHLIPLTVLFALRKKRYNSKMLDRHLLRTCIVVTVQIALFIGLLIVIPNVIINQSGTVYLLLAIAALVADVLWYIRLVRRLRHWVVICNPCTNCGCGLSNLPYPRDFKKGSAIQICPGCGMPLVTARAARYFW